MKEPLLASRSFGTRSLVAVVAGLMLLMAAAPLSAAPARSAALEDHFAWSIEMPGSYSLVRPAVADDGTIYTVDVAKNLFAVAPDGTVKWTAADAGSKGVDVGPDGTIYTGTEDWVKAFNPDGTLKWTFVQTPRAFVFIDVAVGPEGHIYGVASSGMGVFSLEDQGTSGVLRWQTPEPYARNFVGYAELEFGPTADGQDQQLYFAANGHIRAVRLSDGASVFTTGGGLIRPRVSPLDGTWHLPTAAYSPDNVLEWEFEFPVATGTVGPSLGASGTHYAVNSGNVLYSIDPNGRENFRTQLDEFVGMPDVDPAESVVLLPIGGTANVPAAVKAVSASNGAPLWRTEIPETGNGLGQFVSSGFAFSPDGDTAYVMTSNFGGVGAHGYLNAISMDPGTGADQVPSVTISSPSDGAVFDSATSISFSASAGDPEDGDLTADLTWSSDLDGAIGSGGSFSASLSDGTHSVTATVTDSAGNTSASAVTISVGTEQGISLSVVGITARNRVQAELSWTGASGARVDVYRDGELVRTTRNDGNYTDRIAITSETFEYQVCEAGSSTCSNVAAVSF